MPDPGWVRIATLRSPDAFRSHLQAGGIPIAFDDTLAPTSDSPFARPLEADGLRAGNRFCVLPMEGWDGTADGRPTELTHRRWRNFGRSGAKLVWGGEAAAAYPYNKNTKKSEFKPLPKPDWMKNIGMKVQEVKKVKMPSSLLPMGIILTWESDNEKTIH